VEQGAEWKRQIVFIPPEKKPAFHRSKTQIGLETSWTGRLSRLEHEGCGRHGRQIGTVDSQRTCFDLTGTPPTPPNRRLRPGQIGNAYEKNSSTIFSPRRAYGERMSMEWMDVARYADTYGYQADRFQPSWPWRDWVSAPQSKSAVQRFHCLAARGDSAQRHGANNGWPRPSPHHRQTNEGGSVDEEFRVEYNADRVHTTAGAFLGLTMECARCHIIATIRSPKRLLPDVRVL